MTEDWVDCPALGPGWRRRQVLRKSGSKCGHSDTYYRSPTGEKFRSRVELMRFLGDAIDLTDFEFKQGIFCKSEHVKAKKRRRRLPSYPVALLAPPKKPPDLLELTPPSERKPHKSAQRLVMKPLSLSPWQPSPQDQEHLQWEALPLLQPPEQLTKRRRRRQQQPLLAQVKLEETVPAAEGTDPDDTIACCASCQGRFPGVMLPRPTRCRWLCPDCRAQRRAFNRDQRYFKRVGCGTCQACQIPEDCGICTVCVARARNPERRAGIKCLLRRCLRIVKKGLACGVCQACQTIEDCGTCYICLRRLKPGLKRQWKCLKRRCLRSKKKVPAKKGPCGSKKLSVEMPPAKPSFTPSRRQQRRGAAAAKWKPSMERDPDGGATARRRKQLGSAKDKRKSGRPTKHPKSNVPSREPHLVPEDLFYRYVDSDTLRGAKSRRNRKCGECEACLLKSDCGRCDFCCDKPKFGGRNLKRQKCRWRQCLHFAMEKELPGMFHLPPPPPLRRGTDRPLGGDVVFVQNSAQILPILVQHVKEEPESPPCTPPPPRILVEQEPGTGLPTFNLLIATSPKIKQERVEPGGDHGPTSSSPMLAGLPLLKMAGNVVVLDDDDEEEEQQLRPPVIMEVCSLAGVRPLSQLDSVLREFLAELNEIPLPAHWEVLPPGGCPNLRLMQRSKVSTVAAAIIHIRPGLYFHVVVRELPVPPEHELYASHPARLTTVDEVVELICNLEAYRLCPGWPAGWHAGERSQACDVLVYAGCCPQCRLNPWPSGGGAH